MLVIQPASFLSSYILPRDPQGLLRSFILLDRTISCEFVGDFFPSKSLVKEPPLHFPPTGSLWREILCLQSHWFIHSFISFGVPSQGALPRNGGKHMVTVHQATHRWKVYIKWGAAWLPKGIFTTLPSLPQCLAAFSTIPSTLAWVDQSPVSQHVIIPSTGYPLHTSYRLPHDPG